MLRANFPTRKLARRDAAVARQATYDALTFNEKLSRAQAAGTKVLKKLEKRGK